MHIFGMHWDFHLVLEIKLDWWLLNGYQYDIWLILELIVPFHIQTKIPEYKHKQILLNSIKIKKELFFLIKIKRTGFLKLFHYTCRIIAKVSSNLFETNSEIILSIRNIDEIFSLIKRFNLLLASKLVQLDLLEVKKIFFRVYFDALKLLVQWKEKFFFFFF